MLLIFHSNIFGVYSWYEYNFIYTDIDECKVGNGGCNDTCVDTDGSYSCTCHAGYELYAYPDFNNISLADGETGTRAGDKIRINHTCVSEWLRLKILSMIMLITKCKS